MTTRALQLDRPRPAPPLLIFSGAVGGLAVGAAAAWSVQLAFALAVVLIVGHACALGSRAILFAMIASVFLEAVTFGGVGVTRVVAPIALFGLVLAMIRGDAVVRGGAPLVWAFAYSMWALASGLWTVSLSATASQLASLAIALVYMLAFAGWLSSRLDLKRTLAVVAIAALGVGLFAILAFIRGSLDVKQGRISGGTGDPNFFAAYQVVAIPLVLVLAGEVRRRWLRVGLYATAVVVIGSTLTTLSRGGLIALGAIVILTLALPSRTLFRSRGQKALVAVAVLLAAALGFEALSGSFVPRLDSLLSEGGGTGRLILWQGALTGFKEHPLTGLGYGAYQTASDNLIFRTPGVSVQSYDLHPAGEVAHSAYLGTAAELGIPGLILFLGVLISTGRLLRRVASRARATQAWFVSRVANALTVSLVGWALASVFLSSETSRPLWIIVGIALALPKLLARAPPEQT